LYACLLLVIAFCGYLFIAVGYNDYIQNVTNYYGHKIAPRFYATRLPRSKEAHEGVVLPVASDFKSQESVDDSDRPEVYQTNTPTLPPTLPARARPASPIGGRASQWQAGLKGEGLGEGDGKPIIPFSYNNIELTEKAFNTLDKLATVMVQNPDIVIVVKGYTDIIGPPPYNKRLSELRAKTVKTYLLAKGISPRRIRTIGMGEQNPLKPNTTVAGRRANRRAEIELQR
ncbi:unnamed protein product, partial [marine sediment metagenome]